MILAEVAALKSGLQIEREVCGLLRRPTFAFNDISGQGYEGKKLADSLRCIVSCCVVVRVLWGAMDIVLSIVSMRDSP